MNQVTKVTVRGWNPETKEEIVGTATRWLIPLSPEAANVTDTPGTLLDLGTVVPLETEETAYGAANGTLAALAALDLSAEADADGSAGLHAGGEVSINQGERRFDGKYLVKGASHRFARGSSDGWHTLLRLVRADSAIFVLPEVGDEVLVAFEHGYIQRPYVIGTLWTGKGTDDTLCPGRPKS